MILASAKQPVQSAMFALQPCQYRVREERVLSSFSIHARALMFLTTENWAPYASVRLSVVRPSACCTGDLRPSHRALLPRCNFAQLWEIENCLPPCHTEGATAKLSSHNCSRNEP
jgi:hypothetical protein